MRRTRKEEIWADWARTTGSWRDGLSRSEELLATAVVILGLPLARLFKLRVGLLHYRTLGRFLGNTEYFLRRRALDSSLRHSRDLLVSGTRPVNRQILKMIGRRVPVWCSDPGWRVLNAVRKRSPDHPAWIDLGLTGWLRGREWSEPGPQLAFTPEEHERGKALLRQLGVPEGAAHVCFFAKDRRYSDDPDRPPDPNSYWGTRDFRNCDVINYLSALDYLAKRTIWCFRMGLHRPETLLPSGLDPRIVDYTGRLRAELDDPDFADAYLQATCKFFIGCTSGIYVLSSMFGRPVAYTNMIPYGECGRMPHDIFLVKTCRDRASGELIPIPKLIEMGLDADWLTEEELEKLDRAGVEFVENNSDDILQLVREMNERIDGEWVVEPTDEQLQQRYRSISPAKCFDGAPFPGRVGAIFLRKNASLISA